MGAGVGDGVGSAAVIGAGGDVGTGVGAGGGIGVGVEADSVLGADGGDVGTGVPAGPTQPATIATIAITTRRQRSKYNFLECLIILSVEPSSSLFNFNHYTSVSVYHQLVRLGRRLAMPQSEQHPPEFPED